jgi:hypothetical protein
MLAKKIEIRTETQNTSNSEATTKRSSPLVRAKNAFVRWLKGPDMTFEQWEKLERKYSPHSSHQAQIYYRERGL